MAQVLPHEVPDDYRRPPRDRVGGVKYCRPSRGRRLRLACQAAFVGTRRPTRLRASPPLTSDHAARAATRGSETIRRSEECERSGYSTRYTHTIARLAAFSRFRPSAVTWFARRRAPPNDSHGSVGSPDWNWPGRARRGRLVCAARSGRRSRASTGDVANTGRHSVGVWGS